MLKNQTPPILSWTAPSHVQHKRSPGWYLIFALVAALLIAYAIYTRSIITAILFVLMMFVILIFSSQASKEITYKVTGTGIVIGNVIYPFNIIKKFWIVYNPPQTKTLNFETTAYLNNRVIAQLGKQDPVALKLALAKYLPEDLEMEESISETLARKLKI